MEQTVSLWGLFISALISSTLAPGGSEVLLAYLVSEKQHSNELLLLLSSTGNTLGAMVTWGMGYFIAKRLPLDKKIIEKNARAMGLLKRWGVLALFFSWLPLIGDGLCLAAGWLRLSFSRSLLIIAIGKVARYSAIIYLFS
ncbi:MAG: DedA family protein [Gammaproteobacteria bacterium]|nr:DedA family protein [Gammaproteobacteria bacterium]